MFVEEDPAEVREATERLRVLLAGLDLGLLLPASLKQLVGLGDTIERLGHGLKTRAAAKVAQSEVWRGDGDRSPEDWLARKTGISTADGGRLVDTGRQIEQLPAVAGAVTRGELSAKQVEAIAGAGAADPGAERRLLEHAKAKTLRELQDECRRTRVNAEKDPDAARRRAHAKRSCRTWTDADGITGHLHMSGPLATIARLDNAIRHRADQTFRTARAEGRREPSEAYAFDAASQLLTGAGGGSVAPGGADAKIIVRVDHAALLRGHPVDGETCEIAGVGPVPVATVREWMDHAFLAAVLTKGEEVQRVVHLGRRFTAAQRTALQWQDPVCAREGCSNRLRLEYDHFEDWASTHTTRLEAGKRFCPACHRLKSTGWRVAEPDADGQCSFTEADRASVAAAAAKAVRSIRARGPDMRPLPDTG
ncbi:MAG: DUF222 domain-containing protein [Acidimicrobiales bacterium]